MKRYILYTCVFIVVVLLTGCANNKVLLSGPVGTKIYDNEYEYLGQIGNDGKLKLKFKSNKPILLAVDPTTQTAVPFGIDYEKHDRRVLYSVGEITGGFFYAPWTWFILKDTWSFPGEDWISLKKEQKLGSLDFPKPTYNEFDRSSFVPAAFQRQESVISSSTSSNTLSPVESGPSNSTVSTKIIKTPSSTLAGDYDCVGKLIFNGTTVENYENLKVTIERSSANEVLVNVYDSDGEAFFIEPLVCSVNKEPDGVYTLSHSVPGVTITVSPNRHISFKHPAIRIDTDIYELDAYSK